jgi:acetaldehyde dehydrogenase/alcohol dehydrogenase
VAEPIGPIAGIIPVTNPTSTVIFKALIALKTRNCILFSPHPSAARVCAYTAELLRRAAVKAGAPENCIQCVSSDRETAFSVLTHPKIHFTLATGGPGIVGAVYRSGKPAIGKAQPPPALLSLNSNIGCDVCVALTKYRL